MKSNTNINDQILDLINWLSTIEDLSVIEKVIKIKDTHTKDWWDDITDDEKESIIKGIKSANNNELTSHEIVKKRYEKWL